MSTLPPAPADDSRAAVEAAAALLWPSPSVARLGAGSAPRADSRLVGSHLLLPTSRSPRLVVPARDRRAAAAAARGRGGDSLSARVKAGALSAGLRAGVLGHLHRHRLQVTAPRGVDVDTIETALSELLGRRVVVALSVGTARVNRKPILQVLSPDGETVAFVKVGHTAAACDLVRAEAATLRSLDGSALPSVELPQVLHLTRWHDLDLLVLSAVGTGRRRRTAGIPYAAMREVAYGAGTQRADVSDSAFLSRLTGVPGQLRDAAVADRYAAAIDRLTAATAGTELLFGSWHGDWTPWNMATLRNPTPRIALWDWERFSTGVPVGLDAAHFHTQALLLRHSATDAAAAAILRDVDELVARADVAADAAPLVVALYLAELASRYLTLVQEPGGEALARRSAWTLGFLATVVARL